MRYASAYSAFGARSRAVNGLLAVAVAAILAAPCMADATDELLAVPHCACDRGALESFRNEIASAETVAEAQELATRPVELARSALARTRWLSLGGQGLAEKEHQLRAGEQAILAAATPEAVAGAFTFAVTGSPVLAGLDVDSASCHYTTLEIVAIILGLILGIIPGIILLIILC